MLIRGWYQRNAGAFSSIRTEAKRSRDPLPLASAANLPLFLCGLAALNEAMASLHHPSVSRRQFVTTLGAATLLAPALVRAADAPGKAKKAAPPAAAPMTPIVFEKRKPFLGLELYSVRGEMQKDLAKTVRAVGKMGYEAVEFYSPYLGWSFSYTKDVRRLIDDLGLRCLSTHNSSAALTDPGTMAKSIELNQILGCRHIICASPPRGVNGTDGWKKLGEQFTAASEQLKSHGLAAGYHNHASEWKPAQEGGPRMLEILAANTPPEFALQLDVGTALESGADTVAWIKANPGRIKSVHLKDWTPGTREAEKSYRVLFAEGVAPWKEIFAAAESVGGVENYLIEQEGSRYPELETVQRCLATLKKMRGVS